MPTKKLKSPGPSAIIINPRVEYKKIFFAIPIRLGSPPAVIKKNAEIKRAKKYNINPVINK